MHVAVLSFGHLSGRFWGKVVRYVSRGRRLVRQTSASMPSPLLIEIPFISVEGTKAYRKKLKEPP